MLITRHISDEALATLVKHFEGCRLTAYPDPGTGAEPYTIGYGSTLNVHPGMIITALQADERLRYDIRGAESVIVTHVLTPITQHQFDAMASFVFNVGRGNFVGHDMLRYVNQGEFEKAAAEFPKWNHAAGKVLAGLTARRAAERTWFETPD